MELITHQNNLQFIQIIKPLYKRNLYLLIDKFLFGLAWWLLADTELSKDVNQYLLAANFASYLA